MPFTNLDSRHFTNAEKTAVNNSIDGLENAFKDKLANLSADERNKFGSVNEKNKLIINKVKDYNDTQPSLSSPDVDWEEFDKDHDSRSFIQNTILRLEGLINGMENAKILHDYDNYIASLIDYDFAKYKAKANAIGFQIKVDELSQFFGGGKTSSPSANPTTDES